MTPSIARARTGRFTAAELVTLPTAVSPRPQAATSPSLTAIVSGDEPTSMMIRIYGIFGRY